MSSESKVNQSSEGNLRGTTESPTTPGTYWFKSETMSRPVMVDVRLINGELMVWWLTRPDEPRPAPIKTKSEPSTNGDPLGQVVHDFHKLLGDD